MREKHSEWGEKSVGRKDYINCVIGAKTKRLSAKVNKEKKECFLFSKEAAATESV